MCVSLSATVVWTFNGGHVPVNSELQASQAGSSALLLSGVTQEENGGVYACLAHLLGDSSRAAGTVELEVYGKRVH